MADKGWIKLHRDIQDNVLWTGRDKFDKRSAWIDLLLMANHKDNELIVNGKVVVVKKGQFITSETKLAEKWHWSRDKVRRYLALLNELRMITKNCTRDYTTITLVNYGKFQDVRTTDKTTNDTTDNTTHKTTNDTTDNTQTRNIKNDKECKECKEGGLQYSDDPERNQEIIEALAIGAVLLPDGSLDYGGGE